ncbi:DNA phosphorothioation system sulfurtransferase DndC [Sulfuricurvum sp.]|uniref:DNA phosphorothioation system sulfurtransferase DndC n=1 Tax=Sulfuricurvum sp. TaxID=2025608 RepID=UPI002E310713|nr:DNA phosphorothioation system sulfurtransferase DndC [Sulfuricurvum sp.]HEX5329410.1 DNA phosphorothioation system sulfurtransferase DndC [Sulfuricurvum sp.]
MNLIRETIEELKQQYFADERPWVVTYSGGKDSTCVLQLVIAMLQELHAEGKDHKHTYVVSSDTTVEMPIIEKYLRTKLDEITEFAESTELKLSCHKLSPKIEESFWTLMVGKGYPAPTSTFRWCTERMKINPATHFLQSLVNKHQSILMLLGVRSAESQARQTSIANRKLNQRGLSPHDNIPNAFVLSPIKHWTNEDVWTYLSNTGKDTTPYPWKNHDYMMSLYDKGSGEGDCNIALNPQSPSCGKTRFGCWVCTVVEKDRSMEGMLKNGEEWMLPLWEYREKIYLYRNDEERRFERRRDGSMGAGAFLPDIRRELLDELLQTEIKVSELYHVYKKNSPDYNPHENFQLIKDDEIELIQANWNTDFDISNYAYRIAQKYNRLMDRPITTPLRSKLENYSDELNIDLFERIYEIEVYRKNISTRYGIIGEIEKRIVNFYKGQFRETN